jgi:hypothetical protein
MLSKDRRQRPRTNGPSLPGAQFVKTSTTTSSNDSARKLISCDGKVIVSNGENEQELFEEEVDRNHHKLKSKRRPQVKGGVIDEESVEAAPPFATIPPLHRSVDTLPMPYSTSQESNIILDENSMRSNEMEFSASTSLRTTASVITAQVGNIFSQQQNFRHNPVPTEERLIGELPHENVRNLTNINQMMIDNRGRAISEEELRALWLASGLCVKCGINRTHRKEKFGPFGIFRQMIPMTIAGICYKGYCLNCYDVHMLRSCLQDPSIPLDLPRNNLLHESVNSMQSPENGISELPERKQSPINILCSSTRIQVCFLVTFLVVAGGIIFLGIKVAKSPDVWISQPPSSAPSISPSTIPPKRSPALSPWKLHSEFLLDVDSFGQRIQLSGNGDIIAVSSPYFEGGKGRFDVYKIGSSSKTWSHFIPVSGTKHIGTNVDDLMGQGMSLSVDGSTLAIGSPGNDNGLVDIYHVDVKTMTITQKGNSIVGPSPLSEFGYSVALNKYGTRVFIGAPKYVEDDIETIGVRGLVQAYDYDDANDLWIQIGSDMIGKSIDSRFGHDVASSHDGSRIIVGAPYDSTKIEHSGTFYCLTLDETYKVWNHYPENTIYGTSVDAQLGKNVAVDESGEVFVTNAKYSVDAEQFDGAGVVVSYFIEKQLDIIQAFGYPISGTYDDAQFGCHVDINAAGDMIVASDKYREGISGAVRIFETVNANLVAYGDEIPGIALGSTCKPRCIGPSVSLATTSNMQRLAIGYECASIDGRRTQTAAIVHLYEISK